MYELNVEGMSCAHCANAVTRSVQAVDAGAKVDVNLNLHKVYVESQADVQQISAAIQEAGYTVNGMKTA